MTVARYGGLKKATIVVREDGLLDVLRERAPGKGGEWFRGLDTLDDAVAVIRAHEAPTQVRSPIQGKRSQEK